MGLPLRLSGKESAFQCKGGLDPLFMKIPWRMKWQPTPVFIPKNPMGPNMLPSMGLQRVRHNLVTEEQQQ